MDAHVVSVHEHEHVDADEPRTIVDGDVDGDVDEDGIRSSLYRRRRRSSSRPRIANGANALGSVPPVLQAQPAL